MSYINLRLIATLGIINMPSDEIILQNANDVHRLALRIATQLGVLEDQDHWGYFKYQNPDGGMLIISAKIPKINGIGVTWVKVDYQVDQGIWKTQYEGSLLSQETFVSDGWYMREMKAVAYWELPEYQSEPKPVVESDAYVYVIRFPQSQFYKIGFTKDPASRLAAFRNFSPYPLKFEILLAGKYDQMQAMEEGFHMQYEHLNIRGEWFELSPDDLAYIKSLEAQNV